MRRLLLIALACAVSLAAELALASTVPLPLLNLFISSLIRAKLDRAAAIGDRPKLVVLAGSNGLFSHRCEVMEPVVGLPCVNASVAVGVGLDYLFARWRPLLHPGDVVYMPMEGEQYTRTWTANRVGPESPIMVREDWRTLARLAPDRVVAAILGVDLRGTLPNLFNQPDPAEQQRNIAQVEREQFNAWGDRIGHVAAEAAGAQGKLDGGKDQEPDAAAVRAGHGTALIAAFVRWAAAHGVAAVGGLPTTFDDVPLPEATLAAERATFEGNGGRFLLLPNRSRYLRHDFFDTRYHLYEACQVRHSIAVATALARLLGRAPGAPPSWTDAVRCPEPAPAPTEAAVHPRVN